ncbi:MAG: hypothetical protein ACP5N3_05980, partial [Candidatus Nanoarchaeia archaeon]
EEQYKILHEEYLRNSDFKQNVEKPIRYYLNSKGRHADNTRLEQLSEYVLRELPFLLNGIKYKNTEYKTMLYPTHGSTLSEFIINILTKEQYSALNRKLNINGDHILIDSPIIE